ncbi:gluconate 2-dehydrogenase subunit 3 family protein [Rhizorhabdus histidinilytica]
MGPISRRALLRTGAVGGSAAGLALLGAPLPATEPVAAAAAGTGHQPLLTALVDTIIPATDTPGAAEAGVADFVTMMVERWMHPEERARFLAGLDSFDATVRRIHGHPFEALPPARRLEILQAMAAAEEGSVAGARRPKARSSPACAPSPSTAITRRRPAPRRNSSSISSPAITSRATTSSRASVRCRWAATTPCCGCRREATDRTNRPGPPSWSAARE